MKTKPFVWFLANKSINQKWLNWFHLSSSGNFGLAMSLYAIEKNGPEILDKIVSEHKTPLAYFISDEYEFNHKVPPIFHERIISPDAKNLNEFSINDDLIPCFKINLGFAQTIDTNSLLLQLQDYFFFKGKNPAREAIVMLIAPETISIREYLTLFCKLGISSLMVRVSENNLQAVQQGMDNHQECIINDKTKKPQKYESWRARIDELDNLIIETLAERLKIVAKMGDYKIKNNLPLFEAGRWYEILNTRKRKAHEKNVDPALIRKIYEAIHLASLQKFKFLGSKFKVQGSKFEV
jgi:chorismate mutase